jgi:hypothetical protein
MVGGSILLLLLISMLTLYIERQANASIVKPTKPLSSHSQSATTDPSTKPNIVKNTPDLVEQDPPMKTEIFNNVSDPLSKKFVNFTNGFRTTIAHNEMPGGYVIVLAGAYTSDPQQGMIVVRVLDEERGVLTNTEYKTPSKHGSVKIQSYDGLLLRLQAEDGYKWSFEIPKASFSGQ